MQTKFLSLHCSLIKNGKFIKKAQSLLTLMEAFGKLEKYLYNEMVRRLVVCFTKNINVTPHLYRRKASQFYHKLDSFSST